MKTLRLSFVSAFLGYKALFSWTSPSLFLAALVVTPLLQVLFFALLGRSLGYQDDSFFIIGNALQGATAASIGGLVGVIAEERRFGTLTAIMMSPASRVAVFLGRIAPGVVLAVFVSCLTSTVGFLVIGWPLSPSSTGLYFLTIIVAAFSGSALGLALSALGLVLRDIFQIAMIAQFALLILSGANVALTIFPDWLALLARLLPLTNAISASRLLGAGDVPSDFWIFLANDVAVGVAWLAIALVLMRLLEATMRRRASMDLY